MIRGQERPPGGKCHDVGRSECRPLAAGNVIFGTICIKTHTSDGNVETQVSPAQRTCQYRSFPAQAIAGLRMWPGELQAKYRCITTEVQQRAMAECGRSPFNGARTNGPIT